MPFKICMEFKSMGYRILNPHQWLYILFKEGTEAKLTDKEEALK